jgi:hypothetical protein
MLTPCSMLILFMMLFYFLLKFSFTLFLVFRTKFCRAISFYKRTSLIYSSLPFFSYNNFIDQIMSKKTISFVKVMSKLKMMELNIWSRFSSCLQPLNFRKHELTMENWNTLMNFLSWKLIFYESYLELALVLDSSCFP